MTEIAGLSQRVDSSYIAELDNDLEKLVAVGLALRSIPEDEMVRWLKDVEGRCLVRPAHPHPKEIAYSGQPVHGLTKEYEVLGPSGRAYRFVVHPQKKLGIPINDVSLKFSKTYEVGDNPVKGEIVGSNDHKVLYLLPLLDRLPVDKIDYEVIRDFLFRHNGFTCDVRRPEVTKFRDLYKAKLPDGREESFEVYVAVHNVREPNGREIKLDLEVAMPKKIV